jgi:hypothetical protein
MSHIVAKDLHGRWQCRPPPNSRTLSESEVPIHASLPKVGLLTDIDTLNMDAKGA